MTKERQYGTWESPVTIDLLCQRHVTFEGVRVLRSNGNLYILEAEDHEHCTIVEVAGKTAKKILPCEYNIGTRVHEYGGGAFAIDQKRAKIIFSNAKDDKVYSLCLATLEVDALAAEDKARYADFEVHPSGQIVAVRETHDGDVRNELVVIDPYNKKVEVVVTGCDFYSSPRWSPSGRKVCWLSWDLGEMPWSGSRLWLADVIERGGVLQISDPQIVAGSGHGQGISQPRWSVDDTLFFADDISGYWQLSKRTLDGGISEVISDLRMTDHAGAEFRLGSCTYMALNENRLILMFVKEAISNLALIDLRSGKHTYLPNHLVNIHDDAICRKSSSEFLVIGSSTTRGQGLYHVQLAPQGAIFSTLFEQDVFIHPAYVSVPVSLKIARDFGDTETSIAGFLYKPQNALFTGHQGSLPPLLVQAHGGPTNHHWPSFNPLVQYWTSRGFAVFLLNSAGSTGYGREYRELLNGQWGAIDAADAAKVAQHLAFQNVVDGSRMGVMGASAGGYLTLATVCQFPHVWAAGISMCGISDTRRFLESTHKFEKRYGDQLLFGNSGCPTSAKQRDAIHDARSPIHHAEKSSAAVLLMQGSADVVVVPSQAVNMERALARRDGTVELMMIDSWGHRLPSGRLVLRMAMEAEERWWSTHLVRAK